MRQRRGYMLVEMLAIIILLGTTAIVVTRVTTLILRVYRNVPVASSALRVQQQWLSTLRDDAWAAPTIETSEGAARLGDVRWSFGDGALTRIAGDDTRRWPSSRAVAWRWDGRSLEVLSGDDAVLLATPSHSAKEPR